MKLRNTVALLAATLVAGSASAALSVFNFDADGDFSSTGPAQMSLFNGNAFGTFGTDTINGASSGVYNFPAATSAQGLVVTHNAAPNGGGAYLNQYTLGYDIKFTNASGYASFFQTGTSNTNDGDLFRNGAGGIGISSNYTGTMLTDTWYRVMFSFDLAGQIGPAKTLYKYINGSLVGTQVLASGVDGRWSLDPFCLILTDEDGETNAGSLSMFSFEDRALTAGEIAVYGGANVPEPSSLALLAIGVLPMLRRRKTAR
jgi:hypothetical protein